VRPLEQVLERELEQVLELPLALRLPQVQV
jgi:hypothetical protein